MAAGVNFPDLNWLAILAAMGSNIVIGFLWYAKFSPTGRIWMRENKFDPTQKPTSAQMTKGLVLMVIGAFLMMFVLQFIFLAFRDAYRLDGERMTGGLTIVDGLMGGIYTWLGFYVPLFFSNVGWEQKSWSLFSVNAGYYLVSLLAAGAIFASMI